MNDPVEISMLLAKKYGGGVADYIYYCRLIANETISEFSDKLFILNSDGNKIYIKDIASKYNSEISAEDKIYIEQLKESYILSYNDIL